MQPVLLAQVGFSALSMLAWGLAAAIPIAIHLFRKRRQKVIYWAAMQLLQKVIDQQSRRTRIQQLVLLVLRVLALLLLATALARPFLNMSTTSLANVAARSNRVLIMIVDTSYSMGYRTAAGKTRLEFAKQYLGEVVADSPTGDAFILIAMDDPTRSVISSPTFDQQSTQAELQKLKETACGCNAIEALAIAENIAAECKKSDTLPDDVQTIIVTDLGRDTWQYESGSSDLDSGGSHSRLGNELIQALHQLKRVSSIHIESLADAKPVNVAIESLTTSTSKPMLGSSFSIDVSVASYGQSFKQLPIQLELDGQVIASQSVDIEANAKIQTRFQASINSVGSHVVSAVIPDDNLQVDNRYDLVVESASGNHVLIVQNGSRSKNPWQVALRAAGDDANSAELQIRTVSDIAWSSLSLDEWDVLILDDVRLNPSGLNKLAEFVESGKAAVVNWGWRQSLSQLSEQTTLVRRVFGFEFVNSSEDGDWTIDPLDYRSPIVAPFAGFPNSGLLTTPIFRYWRIGNRTNDLMVDVSLSSGDPWLVRNRLGNGWVASFLSAPESGQASSATNTWNAVTTWPSFLPLAQQLIQTISDADSRVYNRLAGQPLNDRLALATAIGSIRLQIPDGSELEIACSQPSESTSSNWSFANTSQRGVYRIIEPANARRAFAVNVNPIQSSLVSADAQVFAEYMKPNATSESTQPETTSSSDDSLARTLLIALMMILVSESLLAWSLGRQSS